MIVVIITIIIMAVKPEHSSPEKMGIKRITVRRQRDFQTGGPSESLSHGTKAGECALQETLKKIAKSS